MSGQAAVKLDSPTKEAVNRLEKLMTSIGGGSAVTESNPLGLTDKELDDWLGPEETPEEYEQRIALIKELYGTGEIEP